MAKKRDALTLGIDFYVREAFFITIKEKGEYRGSVDFFYSVVDEIIDEIKEKALEKPKQRWKEYFSRIEEKVK